MVLRLLCRVLSRDKADDTEAVVISRVFTERTHQAFTELEENVFRRYGGNDQSCCFISLTPLSGGSDHSLWNINAENQLIPRGSHTFSACDMTSVAHVELK